ncbi:hypothetical protein [Pedobacter gandavensis]|uniref:DUF4355 domain-containing protein n=1 Tax=Pedobacter gandavensis TaxID=2679963 RepID=A0ABR6EVG9_9SPHI|nr:hypothetical protein [Pedobacter gandavensis]MBB2148814.1 hypothetical protein [Pedobacter gandavensis]
MSLKIRVPARLKALFTGVALSKKSIDAITEKATVGLTDESTDEEIDVVLNARNEVWSFDEQRKFDDYQAGKVSKDAADKEAARLKAIADGKPEPVEIDPNETKTEKMLRLMMEKLEKQDQAIAAMNGEKVTNTRKDQLTKILENTPDAFKNKAIKDFNRMKFDTDDEFNDYLTETENDAADFVQEQSNAGLGVDTPAAGFGKKTGEKEVSPEMKELIAERTAQAAAKTAQNT